jgi:hypothetical protein
MERGEQLVQEARTLTETNNSLNIELHQTKTLKETLSVWK